MKSYGTMEGVYINGAPQGITLTDVDFRLRQDKMSKLFCAWLALKFHETDNFTLYPASILTVNKNRFTKHYFIGNQRIASRIGTGTFNNVYGVNGSYITAGQQDYAERMNQIQSQKEAYYKELGIAPGVPTEKGAYGDPENTGVGYNTIITNLGDHSVPEGWMQTPKHNTAESSTPGTPISWNDPSTPDDPQAGYGYIANDTTAEETFFFHSDHLGSTSYITDDKGNITQYDAYLPYGELLVDEHSSSEDMPYKFNAKEFDEETGLYYYGARYMNPMASIWYGVDPLAEKYVNISSYLYCHANPIVLMDPTGMEGWLSDWWKQNNVGTRLLGGVQMVSGSIEAVGGGIGGILTAETGVGLAGGVALLLHGADNAYAGAKQMWTGKSQTTCTYAGTKYASQKLGASEETADKIATTVDVGTSFVGGGSGLYKSNRFVTGRLQKHVNQAVKEVDSEGLKALTQKQLRAVQKNSRLYPAYRGNRIDVRTRQKVGNDKFLKWFDIKSNYTNGPDFTRGNKWWDMTTHAQWQKHVNKYGKNGTLLNTAPKC